MPVPFQLKGKQPEDWVKLKNDFMESVLGIWRRYATNLTDDNIEMKVAMDPFYISGRWPNMRRGSVWVARKIARQMGVNRPIEELSGYRSPIEGLYQVGAATHPADAVIAGSGRNCWQVMKKISSWRSNELHERLECLNVVPIVPMVPAVPTA